MAHHIEKLLPRRFLLELGTYVQTCAHIELLACGLLVCLKGKNPSDPDWFASYSTTRKLGTANLRIQLESASSKAGDYGFQKDLKALCDWIKQFTNNRHIAVHGAFVGTPEGFLRVDYLHKEKRNGNPEFRRERTAVTPEIVAEALNDADRIYITLMGMLEQIRLGLSSEVYRAAIPCVVHPDGSPNSQ